MRSLADLLPFLLCFLVAISASDHPARLQMTLRVVWLSLLLFGIPLSASKTLSALNLGISGDSAQSSTVPGVLHLTRHYTPFSVSLPCSQSSPAIAAPTS